MSQVDELYELMRDDLELEGPSDEKSEIVQFFEGKTVFITGVTGFMGTCLIEKMLRSCWGLKHIYVLMREKKGTNIGELQSKFFQNEIFDRLRDLRPDFECKVTALKGDIAEDNLGLSEEDRKTLRNETDIMIHNAANVKFNIRVSLSLKINVLGTKHMLDLAEECLKLKLFMYVSTAYSHCYQKDIEEVFYQLQGDMDEVNVLIRKDSEIENGLSEEAVKAWLGKFPNIYTYSKAVSEDLVRQYGQKAKYVCAVYRPSIVTSAYKEPLAGWCGNQNGPVLVFLGAGLGLFHTAFHANYPIDLIPSDLAINALIASLWDAYTHRQVAHEAVIYNYGSTTINPTNLEKFANFLTSNFSWTDTPPKAVWKYFVIFTMNPILFWTCHILFHFIPACIADLVLLAMGKKPRAVALFLFASKHLKDIDYFGNGNWRIHVKETLKMIGRLNSKDKEIFYCDMRPHNFDWNDYSVILWRGLMKYTLKQKWDSNSSFRKHIQLCVMHYGLITVLVIVFGNLFLKCMRNIFLM